jgi:hypothetical protein
MEQVVAGEAMLPRLSRVIHVGGNPSKIAVTDGRLVVGSDTGMISVWDLATGEQLHMIMTTYGAVKQLALTKNTLVAAAGDAARAWILDKRCDEPKCEWSHEGTECVGLIVSKKQLLVGFTDGLIRLMVLKDWKSMECVSERTLNVCDGDNDTLHDFQLTDHLITASTNGMVKMWCVETLKLLSEKRLWDETSPPRHFTMATAANMIIASMSVLDLATAKENNIVAEMITSNSNTQKSRRPLPGPEMQFLDMSPPFFDCNAYRERGRLSATLTIKCAIDILTAWKKELDGHINCSAMTLIPDAMGGTENQSSNAIVSQGAPPPAKKARMHKGSGKKKDMTGSMYTHASKMILAYVALELLPRVLDPKRPYRDMGCVKSALTLSHSELYAKLLEFKMIDVS